MSSSYINSPNNRDFVAKAPCEKTRGMTQAPERATEESAKIYPGTICGTYALLLN